MKTTWCIEQGDCLEVLKRLPDNFVHAVVTDPPAGIAFMGKEWDRMKRDGMTELQAFQEFIYEVFKEVYRVLKPGGHAVVWALPRTSHHTAMGLERAGFDIRDNGTYLFHLFGSGFPKSHNVGNATGDERFAGWGTALKPAVEFWIVARKPLDGTVAKNVLAHGTGALNIDGCRIATKADDDIFEKNPHTQGGFGHANASVYGDSAGAPTYDPAKGRWPAHLILDEGAASLLDEQSGFLSPAGNKSDTAEGKDSAYAASSYHVSYKGRALRTYSADKGGGASRFFYVPKANKRDKDEGLDDLPEHTAGEKTNREEGSDGITPYAGSRAPSRNSHPTVKSTALMTWLVRLVAPKGSVVLDPFAGSGSTGKAALREGCHFIGIERETEYVEIARRRLAFEDSK